MNFFFRTLGLRLISLVSIVRMQRMQKKKSCIRVGLLYGKRQPALSLFLCRVFHFSSFWCKTSLCPAEFTSNYGDRWWETCQIWEQQSESLHPNSRLRIQNEKACWLETDAFKGHCSFGRLRNEPHHLPPWLWPQLQLLIQECPQEFLLTEI